MLGAMLLSAPPRVRNRNLFTHLLGQCATHILSEPDQSMLLLATIATDDNGHRAKISSICAPWDSLDTAMVNGYPESLGSPNHPPAQPYDHKLTDDPVFAGPTPVDIMALGALKARHVPSRSTCVYSSVTGSVVGEDTDHSILGDLLMRMSLDEDPKDVFIRKLQRNVLAHLKGNFAGQILTASPDPQLVLLRSGRPIYLSLAYQHGVFYLVWSDFILPHMGYGCCVWPLTSFERGPEDMVIGCSIRLLRRKWVRWLSPRDSWSNTLLGADATSEQTAAMRVPVAIAALSEWLTRHSNESLR